MTPVGRDDSERRASQDFALRGDLLCRVGKGGKPPPGETHIAVGTGSLRLQFVPPGPPFTGDTSSPFRRSSGAQNTVPGLIQSGPLGPAGVQNFGLCHFTAAPGSDQPWQRVRGGGAASGIAPKTENGRANVPPLRRFRDPVWFQRDRRGFKAAAVAISRMTEIAL